MVHEKKTMQHISLDFRYVLATLCIRIIVQILRFEKELRASFHFRQLPGKSKKCTPQCLSNRH